MSQHEIRAELERVAAVLGAPPGVGIELETPREKGHGTSPPTCDAARQALRASPRAIAERIVAEVRFPPGWWTLSRSPGRASSTSGSPGPAERHRPRHPRGGGRVRPPAGGGAAADQRRVRLGQSDGPAARGHGRGAALGDCVASLLAWLGHDVAREFYVKRRRRADPAARRVPVGTRAAADRPRGVAPRARLPRCVSARARGGAGRGARAGLRRPAGRDRRPGVPRLRRHRLKAEQRADLDASASISTCSSTRAVCISRRRARTAPADRPRAAGPHRPGCALRGGRRAVAADDGARRRQGPGAPEVGRHFHVLPPRHRLPPGQGGPGFDRAIDVWGATTTATWRGCARRCCPSASRRGSSTPSSCSS